MSDEDNDKHHDDFSFPDEGEYQFDETHDFTSDDDFNFDESEDFGFEEDDGGYTAPEVESEKAVETAVQPEPAAVEPNKKKSLMNQSGKKNNRTLILGGILGVFVLGGAYMMFTGSKSSVPKQEPRRVATKPVTTKPLNTEKPLVKSPQRIIATEPAQAPTAEKPTVQQQAGQAPRVMMPAPSNEQQTAPSAALPQTSATPTTTTARPAATSGQNGNLLQQAIALNAKAQEQIANLEGKNADLREAIDKLKEQNENNADKMQKMQNSMAKLAEETQRLHKAMYVLINAAKKKPVVKRVAPRPKPAVKSTKTRKVAATKRANYYVDAIIPGRAWLKDQDGNVVTVSVGDLVSGYGRVTRIDPENGIVRTSSGAKFEYGIQEG